MSENSKNIIYKDIRRSIIMGHYESGERLHIEKLAEQFKTSVTPVRDSLQMLNQEGLVTIKPRSGYFVTKITLKELSDMFELRNTLELAAIETAAEKITDEEIEVLCNVHAGYTGDDDESYDRYTDENRKFHYLLAKAAGNDELASTLGGLLDRLARFMVLRQAGETQQASHELIINALKAHDGKAAKQALIADIGNTREAAIEKILETEASSWHL